MLVASFQFGFEFELVTCVIELKLSEHGGGAFSCLAIKFRDGRMKRFGTFREHVARLD